MLCSRVNSNCRLSGPRLWMFTNIRRWPQTFGYPGFKHKGTEQDSYRDMFTSMLDIRMPDYHSITIITILFRHMQIPLNMFIFTASFRILRPRMARGPRTAVDRHGHCRSSILASPLQRPMNRHSSARSAGNVTAVKPAPIHSPKSAPPVSRATTPA